MSDIGDSNPDKTSSPPIADLVKIKEWLQPTPFDQEKSEYSRHRASHLTGTGSWLTSLGVFQQWHSGENGLLWITGIPASGKSVMAASIIHQLQKEEVPVLYFFFRQIIDANHRPVAALRDWLCQILDYSHSLQIELNDYRKKDRAIDSVSLDDFWGLLKKALNDVPKAYCVIDALDEMDKGNENFLENLAQLGKWRASHVKVLMTSRPIAVLESSLRMFNIPQIRLEERLVDTDIAIYVQYNLQRSSIPQENWKIIKEVIPGRANGLFLYAKLSMDAFLEPGADPTEVLKALPANLNMMYDDLLRNSAKQYGVPESLQLLVLQFVTHATRPLRLLELADMINAVYSESDTHQPKTPRQTKDWVRATCGPLIEILPDETVSVIHHSMTEFLKGLNRTSDSTTYPVLQPGATNEGLAVSCLKYLRSGCLDKYQVKKRSAQNLYLSSKKSQQSGLRLQFPFLEYAAENWPTHARRAAKYRADMTYLYAMLDVFFKNTQQFRAWLDLAWPTSQIENVTPLHVAAHFGLVDYAAHLLERKEIEIEARDQANNTPIYWAASPGNAEVVRLLLENGAEPDASQEVGLKPLHAASRNNHPEVVRLLLAAGVSPLTYKTAGDPGRTCGNAPTSYGHTALMYACHNGHVDVVKEYLPYLTPETSYRGLSWAAEKSRANIVKLLLEIPGVDVNGKYRGDTTLYTACRNIDRDPETIKILLQAGADPNIICKNASDEFAGMRVISLQGEEPSHPEPRGFTALHALCKSKPTLEGMHLLLQAGADVHIKTPDGQTALHLACKNSSAYSIVESLLQAGLDPTEEADDGSTPLHTRGSTDEKLLPILLKTGRVDINKRRSKDGWTPLRCRLEHYGTSFLDFLQYKPDVNITDNDGNSILHSVVSTYSIMQERLTAILSAGADAKAKNLNGESILHVVNYSAKIETLRLLLDAGADIEARDQQGQTPLFKYVNNSYGEEPFIFFRMLIDLGADIHARDYKGQTLLHHSSSGQIDFMDHLIRLGLNPGLTDNDGNTPLHTAAFVQFTYPSSRVEALRYLVDRGLNFDQPNHGGRIPLHMLCMSRAREEEAINHVIASSTSHSVSDINGIQPLHIAATVSQSYVLILLNAGADIFGTTNEGMTVLQIAARACHPNIIGLVLERALKAGKEQQVSFVNQRNDAGKSALHYACASGHLESVRVLLEAGADPNLQDNDGSSPFIDCLCRQNTKRAPNSPGRRTRRPADDSGQDLESFVSSVIFIDNEKQKVPMTHGSSQDENDTREKYRMEEIFDLLIRHGAVVSGENGCFEKAFRSALSAENDYAVKCLIQIHTRLQIEKPLNIIDPDMKYLTCINRLEDAKRTLLESDKEGKNEKPLNAGKLLVRKTRRYLLKSSLSERQYEAFEELVIQGAGPSEVYFDGTSILHDLASQGFGDLLSRFCSRETALAFDDPGWREKILNEHSRRPRSVMSLLSTACSRDAPNMDVVRRLVETYGVDVNALSKLESPKSKPGQDLGKKARGSGAIHELAHGKSWWHAAEALPYLIQKGANIELRDKSGRTPLHIALSQSKDSGSFPFYGEIVRYLIENGADVNAVDDKGKNCLSIAVDDLRLTRYLMANGANVTSEAVFNAIKLMKVEILDLLLSQNSPDHQRRLAVRPSRANDCASPIFPTKKVEDSEIPPLLYAAIQEVSSYKPIPNFLDRKMRIMTLLLGYGADPYASFTKQVVARRKSRSIFEGPDVDAEWEMQETTIIHDILARGQCAKPILILPSLNIEARDRTGRTLLLATSQNYCVNVTTSDGRKHEPEPSNTVFRDLVDRGADVMAQDNKGRTILHHLCHVRLKKNEHSLFGEFLRNIIAKNPRLVHLVDEAGETALHYVLRSNNTDYRDFLVENGSDLLLPDKDGNTILHSLARNLRNKKDNENLFNAGVGINSRNHQGDTPLSTYIQEHVDQAVKDPHFDRWYFGPKDEEYTDTNFLFFKEKGADFFTINNAGSSLLHLIAGIKLSTSGQNYRNKFAKKTLADRFKFLMRMGLDPMAEDAQLRTSIDIAAACGNEHIVKIFERKQLD